MVRRNPVTDLDRRRLRTTWRTVMVGVIVGIVGAAVLAALGLGGRAGFAAVVLGTAAGCVVAALLTAILAIVDEARREPVATRRLLTTLALFGSGALLLTLVVAVAGANA